MKQITPKLSQPQLNEAFDLYVNQKFSLESIAKRFGVSYPTARKHLLRHGLKTRALGATNTILSEAQLQSLVSGYEQGIKIDDLVKKFGIAKVTIHRNLRRAGIRTHILQISHHYDTGYFRNLDSEEKAYWFGFIVADGSIREEMVKKHQYVLKVSLQERDRDHLLKFIKCIGGTQSAKSEEYKSGWGRRYKSSTICVCGKEIVCDLINAGIQNIKKGDAQSFKSIRDDLKRHFLRGFIDGDGWICQGKKKHYVGWCTETETFARMTKAYFEDQLGIRLGLAKRGKIWVVVTDSNRNVMPIIKHVYEGASVWLDRKKTKADMIQSQLNGRWPINGIPPEKWLLPHWSDQKLRQAYDFIRNYKPKGMPISGQVFDSTIQKHFHKAFWLSTRKGSLPIPRAFDDKQALDRSIAALRLEGGALTYNRLLRQLCFMTDYKYPSNQSARYTVEVLSKVAKPGDIVYDPCAGWGSRWLGSVGRCWQYVCSEPNELIREGLLEMAKYFNEKIDLHSDSIQDNPIQKCDIIWTSPPFGDSEIYFGGDKIPENFLDLLFNTAARMSSRLIILHIPEIYTREGWHAKDVQRLSVRSLFSNGDKRHSEYIVLYERKNQQEVNS